MAMSIDRPQAPSPTIGYIPLPSLALDALRAVSALEDGDWRTAAALAPQLGRCGLPVRLLALSMRERSLGLVAESWQALAGAAASGSAERRPPTHLAGPGDPNVLSWPIRLPAHIPTPWGNEFWARFSLVGRREETEARQQWLRIENSACPKRTSMIEGCVDHLSWVVFDGFTWQYPQADEWLPVNDRVTRGRLGEAGREYFVRRANELYHSVFPLQGSLTRKVWEDLGLYRGLHEQALSALAAREDDQPPEVGRRQAHALAVDCARVLVKR